MGSKVNFVDGCTREEIFSEKFPDLQVVDSSGRINGSHAKIAAKRIKQKKSGGSFHFREVVPEDIFLSDLLNYIKNPDYNPESYDENGRTFTNFSYVNFLELCMLGTGVRSDGLIVFSHPLTDDRLLPEIEVLLRRYELIHGKDGDNYGTLETLSNNVFFGGKPISKHDERVYHALDLGVRGHPFAAVHYHYVVRNIQQKRLQVVEDWAIIDINDVSLGTLAMWWKDNHASDPEVKSRLVSCPARGKARRRRSNTSISINSLPGLIQEYFEAIKLNTAEPPELYKGLVEYFRGHKIGTTKMNEPIIAGRPMDMAFIALSAVDSEGNIYRMQEGGNVDYNGAKDKTITVAPGELLCGSAKQGPIYPGRGNISCLYNALYKNPEKAYEMEFLIVLKDREDTHYFALSLADIIFGVEKPSKLTPKETMIGLDRLYALISATKPKSADNQTGLTASRYKSNFIYAMRERGIIAPYHYCGISSIKDPGNVSVGDVNEGHIEPNPIVAVK